MSWALATILLAGAVAAVEPLSEAQLRQLETATDFTPSWDEPALYPLLQNVLRWDTLDEAGAMIPDWNALSADPESYRGRLFLVRGQLGGPPEKLQRRLARPGPWDGKIERWGILYRVNPDQVAVIYLVDPPPPAQTPRVAARVQILCRFYKIWRFDDLEGRTTDYPVFIGKTVSRWTGASGEPPRTGDGGVGALMARLFPVIVLLLIFLFVMLRRTGGGGGLFSTRPRPLASQRQRIEERRIGTINAEVGHAPRDDAGLPEDPAEALDRLAQPNDDAPPTGGENSEPTGQSSNHAGR